MRLSNNLPVGRSLLKNSFKIIGSTNRVVLTCQDKIRFFFRVKKQWDAFGCFVCFIATSLVVLNLKRPLGTPLLTRQR